MPKFYVTCGCQQQVVACENAQQAAFQMIDDCLSAHMWIYDDAELTEQDRRDHLVLEALMHLGTSVDVSERGNGRCEAGQFEVPKMIDQWHKLMTSLARVLSEHGLDETRILPSAAEPFTPRRQPK